jgi:hypothetical protein
VGTFCSTLERLNGFATGERHELSERHSHAERRLQPSILRRLSQRPDVYVIFGRQLSHGQKAARRLLQSPRLRHDRTRRHATARIPGAVRLFGNAQTRRTFHLRQFHLETKAPERLHDCAHHAIPRQASEAGIRSTRSNSREWLAKKYFWWPVSDRSER